MSSAALLCLSPVSLHFNSRGYVQCRTDELIWCRSSRKTCCSKCSAKVSTLPFSSLLPTPLHLPRPETADFMQTWQHKLKDQRWMLLCNSILSALKNLHKQACKQWSVSSYMLLFFRGELTERLLFWLREPPMATAQSVFVLLSQILRTTLSPPEVHLCLSSVQPGSTSEPHGALPLMTDWLSFNQANLSSLPLCWCCTVQRLRSISDLTRIAVHTVPPPCSTCLTLFLHTLTW